MQDLESILARINQRQSELNILRQNLDNVTIKEALKVEFLYESNRIEGNSITEILHHSRKGIAERAAM